MIEIRPLEIFRLEDLKTVMPGYTSTEKYAVTRTEAESGDHITFDLQRVVLHSPYVKQWNYDEDAPLEHYTDCVTAGTSLGAFDGVQLVGLAIAEVQTWNKTLCIWELGVAEAHQRRGIGRDLIREAVKLAERNGLRALVIETQNTNVPAIRFYRGIGFTFEAIDVSFYGNDELDQGEVAIFMRRKLT